MFFLLQNFHQKTLITIDPFFSELWSQLLLSSAVGFDLCRNRVTDLLLANFEPTYHLVDLQFDLVKLLFDGLNGNIYLMFSYWELELNISIVMDRLFQPIYDFPLLFIDQQEFIIISLEFFYFLLEIMMFIVGLLFQDFVDKCFLFLLEQLLWRELLVGEIEMFEMLDTLKKKDMD